MLDAVATGWRARELRDLKGLTAKQAAERLAVISGVVSERTLTGAKHPHVLQSKERESDGVDAYLSDLGVSIQVVPLGQHKLERLITPALLRTTNKQWLILLRVGRRRSVLESAKGKVTVRSKDLFEAVTPQAIFICPDLPRGESVFKRFLSLIEAQLGALSLVVLAVFPLQLLGIAAIELTSQVVGRALPDGANGFLEFLVASVITATLLAVALSWFRDRTLLTIAAWIEVSAKRGYLSHTLSLPFNWLQGRPLGLLLQGVSGLSAARSVLLERVLGAALDGFALLGYSVAMGLKLWSVTLALIMASGAIGAVVFTFGKAQARIQARETKAQAEQRGFLAEMITGVRTIKASGVEDNCAEQWVRRYDEELALALYRQRVGIPPQMCMDFIRNVFPAALLIWGGYEVMQGELDLGRLMAIILLGMAFVRALIGLFDAGLAWLLVWPQLQPMIEVLGQVSAERGKVELAGEFTVRVRDVWFRHQSDGDWIIQGKSLDLAPGEVHLLDGVSGSGKTTLLRLLAGLYTPQKGVVSIGGLPPTGVKGAVLYLPQVVQLFSGSLMDNLRMFSNNASLDRLLAAAKLTGLEEIVQQLPLGYETPVTRGGTSFSGGQRQILALTAVLASEATVLLLDEPMANLDARSAASMRRLLIQSGRTIVIAGHR